MLIAPLLLHVQTQSSRWLAQIPALTILKLSEEIANGEVDLNDRTDEPEDFESKHPDLCLMQAPKTYITIV